MTIHLNLGSNLGDREAILGRAESLLRDALHGRFTCSPPLETPAWGYASDNRYLNKGIMIQTVTSYTPLEVLNIVEGVQKAIDPSPHRDDKGGYVDRKIDIDIIAIDELTIETPQLTLPHPRMHQRRFVLEPMKILSPQWRHPLLHLTPEEMLQLL